MKMVVGLGNPGVEYQNTRHNVGFMIIDDYLKKQGINKLQKKFDGLYSKVYMNRDCFIVLKPQLYMNLSGQVIKKYADYFKINPEDILVIHDDLDMPTGKIKIKYKGSCGGHNGIRNIIDNLGTDYFPRFKVGISRDNKYSIKDYVLGEFSSGDLEKIRKICTISPNIIEDFICRDIERVMSKYNGAEYEFKD